MLVEWASFILLFSFAMAIIAFTDQNLPKTQTKPNKWLESALLHLEEMVAVLNAKNAVMFESEGSFIHLATGGVLFKGMKHQQWRSSFIFSVYFLKETAGSSTTILYKESIFNADLI